MKVYEGLQIQQTVTHMALSTVIYTIFIKVFVSASLSIQIKMPHITVTSGSYRPLCLHGPETGLLHKGLLADRPPLETWDLTAAHKHKYLSAQPVCVCTQMNTRVRGRFFEGSGVYCVF